jgi:hypothetical protein
MVCCSPRTGAVSARPAECEKGSSHTGQHSGQTDSNELGVAQKPLALTDAERHASRMIPIREKGKELYNVDYVARKFAQDMTVRKVWAALSKTVMGLNA